MTTRSPLPAAAATEALGRSEPFLSFQEALSRAAAVDRPVLLVGERGSGKELAAARLHYHSPRWDKPFVALNCAALAPALIESELFGHEAGAFTGALARRAGRFEAADSGSLFLDEVSRMPAEVQEKILRVVEYGTFERVGASEAMSADVRLIAATNEDLPSLAAAGRFKPDLLDRLSFLVLTIPPLRARGEDVLLLAEHFASRMAVELGREEPPRLTATARVTLLAHPWPGNVRELKNTVERALFLADGPDIEDIPLDPFASPYRPASYAPTPAPARTPDPDLTTPLPDQVKTLKLTLLRQALARARHNQHDAAKLLGLSYHALRALYRSLKDEL